MKKLLLYFFLFLLLFLIGCRIEDNHEHIACEECGKCISEDCDGLEEEKCLGHIIHEHIACEDCGKCISEDCDGLEEEKCLGHIIHEHIACEDCGKCISEDCDGSEEEKCLGHIIHEHIACEECGKCISEECDGSEEEKCLGHIIHEHIVCEKCGKCISEDCEGLEEEKCLGHIIHNHIECEDCKKCILKDCDGLEEEKCPGHVKLKAFDNIYVSYINTLPPLEHYYIINTYQEYIEFINENYIMELVMQGKGLAVKFSYNSVIDDYDESYFVQNSLFIYVTRFSKFEYRYIQELIYDINFENKILTITLTMMGDVYTPTVRGRIISKAEISKYVLENLEKIEYKAVIVDPHF